MKKNNSNSHHVLSEDGLKEFANNFHEFWDTSDDEIDKRELRHFIDDENMPKFRELNDSDVSVEDVLVIGSYVALNRLHNDFHEAEHGDIASKIEDLFDGKVTVKAIAPKDMPKEVREIVEGLVEVIQKNRKKSGRGKK